MEKSGSPTSSPRMWTVVSCCSKASMATADRPSPTTENLQLRSPFSPALAFSRSPALQRLNPRTPPNHLRHKLYPIHRSREFGVVMGSKSKGDRDSVRCPCSRLVASLQASENVTSVGSADR